MSQPTSAVPGAEPQRATRRPSPGALARFVVGMAVALARRPGLVPTAMRQLVVMAPRRWWAHPPHLPVPPSDYLEFRQVTATGRTEGPPEVDDTIVWLEWCRSMHTLSRG